jgi:hypothetical protein
MSAAAPAAVRRGFILVQDTLCDGVVPGEWSVDGGVILYDTLDAAELERAAWAELHDEAMRDAWVRCMTRAMDEVGLSGPVRTWLDGRFFEVADFLRNTEG